MPERAIAHRQKRADRRLLDAPSEGGHHQYFKVAIRRPVHVCPDIPRVSQGTRWKSYSYSASISNLRGAGHPAALPPLLVVPRSASRVIHSPPTALFLDLLSARRLARDAATWQS